ncbi:hypothetical protein E1258_18140 [Micromonospora sp. KC207]|uniref:hypothetical protein n=1 Tax=Micromonospora sp. KC207 TaxID=2530377 RepID=UPI0010531343|nr:hypothetical protein [Micromonospora sp. KC207]TDC59379.1 hypothetical protein E1258_18140 [Micromonospora sp. KC207]
MTNRTLASALVPLLLIASACTSSAPEPEPTRVASFGEPALVFRVGQTLHVSDGDGNVKELLMMDSDPEQVLWSPDGARLAWANTREGESGSDTVYVADATTGAVRSHPCPCRGLGFLGDDLATVSADGTGLILISTQGDLSRVTFRKPITTRNTAEGAAMSARVVAGGRDRVVVQVPLDEAKAGIRAQSTLMSVDRAGGVTELLHNQEGAAVWEGLGSPTGDRIAWLDMPSSGACWHSQRIVDLGYADARPTDPAMPTDDPFRRAHLPAQQTVLSYSWAGAGVVQTFGPVGAGCQVMYPFRLVSYYRQGSTWTHLATGLLGIAFGADGRTARLAPAATEGPIESLDPDDTRRYAGRLVLSVPGASDRTLAENVEFFAFTPAQAAAARITPASTPPTPVAEPAGTDERGAQLSGPLYDLVLKVWTAAGSGDPAALNALCTNCDVATRTWLANDGGAKVRRLLTSHPRFLDDKLTYPGLAVEPCADATGGGDTTPSVQTCTPEHLADVVTLSIEPEVDLDYPAYGYRQPAAESLVFRLEGGSPVWAGRA